MVLQVALGLSAWLFGAGAGAFDYRPVTGARAGFASAHVATGALMLATSLILTMRAHRHLTVPGKIATVGLGTMEVVA
jgi:hypothetical protein